MVDVIDALQLMKRRGLAAEDRTVRLHVRRGGHPDAVILCMAGAIIGDSADVTLEAPKIFTDGGDPAECDDAVVLEEPDAITIRCADVVSLTLLPLGSAT